MAVTRRRRGTAGPIPRKNEERARANRRALRPQGAQDATPAMREAATARLDPWYAEDDPSAPDAAMVATLDDLDLYAPIADITTYHRADGDSKRRRYCEPCGKWYMADAQLLAHRVKVHGASPKPASRRTARTAPPAPVAASPAVPVRLICPRCGRTDWRANGVGLRWHLDNYPACANGRKAPEHVYIQA